MDEVPLESCNKPHTVVRQKSINIGASGGGSHDCSRQDGFADRMSHAIAAQRIKA